jgi:hypothetical protein
MKTILKISTALFILAAFGVGCGSSNNNGTCVAGQTMVNNVCTATLGAGLVNGQCVQPSMAYYGQGGVQICCPAGFNPNSYPPQTVTATCPQVNSGYGSQYGGGTQCQPGYFFNGVTCIP